MRWCQRGCWQYKAETSQVVFVYKHIYKIRRGEISIDNQSNQTFEMHVYLFEGKNIHDILIWIVKLLLDHIYPFQSVSYLRQTKTSPLTIHTCLPAIWNPFWFKSNFNLGHRVSNHHDVGHKDFFF